jgi:hypothetical protein
MLEFPPKIFPPRIKVVSQNGGIICLNPTDSTTKGVSHIDKRKKTALAANSSVNRLQGKKKLV